MSVEEMHRTHGCAAAPWSATRFTTLLNFRTDRNSPPPPGENRRTQNTTPAKMEKLTYYWKKLRQNKLAYNLVLIAAIILAMAVTAHFVMQVGTRHGARRIVPDFSGVKLDDAQRTSAPSISGTTAYQRLAVRAGLRRRHRPRDQPPEGGVEVKPGRTVYITINSFRQKMVPVPYVVGRSLRQAKNMLEIAGLEIGELIYRADTTTNYVLEEYYEGRPVTQNSRSRAEMGSGVTLYVGVEGGFRSTVVPCCDSRSRRPRAVCGSWGSMSARSTSTKASTC